MEEKRPWRVLYMWLTIGLALAVLGLNLPSLRFGSPWSFSVFLALSVIADWLAVRLPNGARIVYGMVVVLPATVILGPIPGAVVGALGSILRRLLQSALQERRLPDLLLAGFSAAQYFLSYALAGAAYEQLAPPTADFWPVAGTYLMALLTFKAMNALLVDQLYNRLRGLYGREPFVFALAVEGAIHLVTAPLGLLMVLSYPAYGLYGVVLSFTPVLLASSAIRRYLQGQEMNRLLWHRADQLAQILRVSETMRTDLDLDLLLERIVRAVQGSLGFNLVMLNLYDEEDQMFVRRAAAGVSAEEFARIRGERIPRQEIVQFFDDRFRVGRCYLVGQKDALPRARQAAVPTVPGQSPSDGLWGADDLLLVPMIARRGELVGVISADDPADGLLPQPETLYALEIFANQAAQAIENVQLYRELRERLLSLEEANQRIQEAQEELSRHSRQLEETVAQRTRELQERTLQLEEALERATEADRLKSEFLANMSHELRTPLNSIIGFSRVILKGIDGPITDLQRTDLTAIYNSGTHLLRLINDILDLSKIEAGRMELRKESVSLAPVIQGVLSTCIPLIEDKPVELHMEVPPDLPPVYADPTRVRQIVLNLVSNAIKFTDRGAVTVRAYEQGTDIIVGASDTGIGIEPKDLHKVFEPFRQAGKGMDRRIGGTGLGLTISQRFVQMHGGRMWVESKPGQGSTFYFSLPIIGRPRPIPTPREAATVVPQSAGRPVLVVDDDPEVISLFRRYLENEGYQVIGATDAVEALRLAWEVHPYAITLDIVLPDEDGWAVLRALKEDETTRDIPVIICSVVQDEDTGFSLGAADYLTKPIMQEELLAALNRLQHPVHRIVVIEDQPEDLELMIRLLETEGGYDVLAASNGEEGLAAIHRHFPDLVILDLMLPQVDGFEVLARLKADHRTRTLPIIVVTAKDLTEEEEARLDGQMSVLLHKGLFRTEDLLADVSRVLRERVGEPPPEQDAPRQD